VKPAARALVGAIVLHDDLSATLHDCALPEMVICLVEVYISSLWVVFSLEVVETSLEEAIVPCICLCLEAARNFCAVVISASPYSCLCIRLDIGRLLLDYESDGATCLLGGEVSGLYDQAHMSRQHRYWEERGHGRVLEEDRLDDH